MGDGAEGAALYPPGDIAVTPGMKRRGGQIIADIFEINPGDGEDWAEEIFNAMLSARTTAPVSAQELSVRLLGRADDLLDTLSQLRLELDRDLPRDACEIVFDFLERPEELVKIETDIGAAGAHELTVRFEPSDRLRMLLSALRAGNVDRLVVE